MSLESYTLHTAVCDHPDCTAKESAATVAVLFDKGWVSELFFGFEMVLCPSHSSELQEWLGLIVVEAPQAQNEMTGKK